MLVKENEKKKPKRRQKMMDSCFMTLEKLKRKATEKSLWRKLWLMLQIYISVQSVVQYLKCIFVSKNIHTRRLKVVFAALKFLSENRYSHDITRFWKQFEQHYRLLAFAPCVFVRIFCTVSDSIFGKWNCFIFLNVT